MIDYTPYEKCNVVLEYSSYAEKDIQASVNLTAKFSNALQRWLHYRNTSYSKSNALALWNFANALVECSERYSSPKSMQRHTVIRSAFVYKKTREQFGLRKCTYTFRFRLTKLQQNLFVAWISQLKLPAELTVRFQ